MGTNIAGRISKVAIDDGGGFVDIGGLMDATLNGAIAELDSTSKDDGQYRTFIVGHRDATLDLSLHWEEDDAGQIKLKENAFAATTASAIFRFRMEEATGKQEFSVTGFVTGFNPTSPLDEVADLDVTVRLSGDFSPTAQP